MIKMAEPSAVLLSRGAMPKYSIVQVYDKFGMGGKGFGKGELYPNRLIVKVPNANIKDFKQYEKADCTFDGAEKTIVKPRKYKLNYDTKISKTIMDSIKTSKEWVIPEITVNDIEEI